ncbi:MAG: dockerin type I repeat-containing protein, partial [Ruminococcus sp.]|nr:dockerin type I repeat-containing protein [Ruminococcus sp.]
FVETTTYVEDITVPTSTTTTALEMDEIYYTQPEGKYPVHYQQRVQYRLEKTFTVDKIADYGIYDENGTRWIFDSRDFDIYDLGKGDVIKVSGLFSYGIGGDEFCCYEGGYEVVKYNDNYEQYAQIEILDGLEHRIVDKRLSHYDHIEYKLEFDDVTVVDVNDRETLTLDNGYRIGFCHTSPDLEFVRAGDHISVSGWFVKFDDIDLFGTSYRNSDPEGFGKFKIISRDTDSIHKECAKPASTGITDMVNLEDVEVTDVADNVITLADGKKYSFNRLASPDVDYVQKGDKIDLIGKFKYNWTTEVYEGTTKASFEIKSRKINVLPENKIKKNIKIENKKIKIDSYRNNVFTDENGSKYYIAPESIFAPQELKTGDTVTINGTFDLFEDEKIYVSYTATIALDENIKLSDKAGDSNVDGDVNLADSVLIMQTIANPAKYNLTAQGRKNADIEGNKDGITAKDALKIQRITLKLED